MVSIKFKEGLAEFLGEEPGQFRVYDIHTVYHFNQDDGMDMVACGYVDAGHAYFCDESGNQVEILRDENGWPVYEEVAEPEAAAMETKPTKQKKSKGRNKETAAL